MQNRGSHYKAQVASSSRHVDAVEPMQSHCATRIGDDQWGTPHSHSNGSVTGEIPMKGRSKLFRAKSCRPDRYMDPASSRQENLHMGPAGMVTTAWDTPHSSIDGSVTGRLDPDRRVAYRVEHHTDKSIPIRVYQHTTPESARDLVHHILSVIAQRLRFRICGVNSQRKDDAIKS
eukprot:5127868-Amphidinium_carterae.1